MQKNGHREGLQRYRCVECARQFQSERRGKNDLGEMWDDYVDGKQTLKQLGKKHERSHVWVRERLDTVTIAEQSLTPQQSVFITDTTFWGRRYGV